MHPAVTLWYAVMVFVVVPTMLWGRSGVAAIIAGAWLGGQLAYISGAPLLPVQFLCHVAAIVVVLANAHKAGALLSGALFIPRAINDISILSGATDPWHGWWLDYWLAWAQLIFLLASIEWPMLWGNIRNGFSGIGLPRLDLMVGHRG